MTADPNGTSTAPREPSTEATREFGALTVPAAAKPRRRFVRLWGLGIQTWAAVQGTGSR